MKGILQAKENMYLLVIVENVILKAGICKILRSVQNKRK